MAMLLVVGFGAADVPFPLFFGLLGFLAGTTFSAILGIVAGQRKFAEMSLRRFAGWGAAGGLLLAGVLALAAGPDAEFLVVGPVFGLAGAISAAGTLALARRSEGRDLLAATRETPESSLNNAQARKLFGGGG
jgi:hypothetical protein